MRKFLWCLLFGAMPLQSAFATQDGDPDLAFGGNGFRFLDTVPIGGVPTNERGLFAHRLANGQLLVAMQAQQPGAQRAVTAVFGANGVGLLASANFPQHFNAPSLDPPLRGFGVDAAERLLIGGTTYDANAERNDPVVVRALPPGYLPDPDFGIGGEARPFAGANDALLLTMAVLPDGRSIVCGALVVPGTGIRGYCVRLTAEGALDWTFGTDARFTFSPPNVTSTAIGSVHVDAQGRVLIAGSAVMQANGNTHGFTARVSADGLSDPDFCASQCTDAFVLQTEPGYRIDTFGAILGAQVFCRDIVERADGVIVAARFPGPNFGGVTTLRYNAEGRLVGGASFSDGDGVVGCGSIDVQPDLKLVVTYTYRDGSAQIGGLVRLVPAPTLDLFFDPAFTFAAASIQAPLGGGVLSTSNECNYTLVEDDGILCVGLTRVGNTPVNLDFMLARVVNGTPDFVFGDGFADDE